MSDCLKVLFCPLLNNSSHLAALCDGFPPALKCGHSHQLEKLPDMKLYEVCSKHHTAFSAQQQGNTKWEKHKNTLKWYFTENILFCVSITLLLVSWNEEFFFPSSVPHSKQVIPTMSTSFCWKAIEVHSWKQQSFLKTSIENSAQFCVDTKHWIECAGFRSFRAEIKVFWKYWAYDKTKKTWIIWHKAIESFEWMFIDQRCGLEPHDFDSSHIFDDLRLDLTIS